MCARGPFLTLRKWSAMSAHSPDQLIASSQWRKKKLSIDMIWTKRADYRSSAARILYSFGGSDFCVDWKLGRRCFCSFGVNSGRV